MADLEVSELPHADVDRFVLRHTHRGVGVQEKAVIRLVGSGLLGGDDEVDRDADRLDGAGDEVVVGVADDGEPIGRA